MSDWGFRLGILVISGLILFINNNASGLNLQAQHVITRKAKVIEESLFDNTLKTQYAKEDTSYKLKCKVNHPQAIIFWTVDQAGPSEPKFKQLQDYNLLIRNLSQEDFSREYFCHAILPGRSAVESMQIELLPRSKEGKTLSFESSPSEKQSSSNSETEKHSKQIYAVVGELKTLTCSVHARPSPDFKWLLLNGTLVRNKTDFIIQSYEDVSNLTVFIRDSTFYGEYICEAWNTLGKTEQHFILRMPEKPTEIPFIFPKTLGLTKILLGILLQDKNSKNYSVQIQYKIVSEVEVESDWDEKWMDHLTGKAEDEISLTNLQPNTTYLIRAAVKSQFILGDYSDSIRVTTDKLPGMKIESKPNRTDRGRSLPFEMDLPFSSYFNKEGQTLAEGEIITINKTMRSSIKIFRASENNKLTLVKTTIEEIVED